MNKPTTSFTILIAAALLILAAQRPSLAGSATWSSNPTSGDWNTAANWMPQTVPNSTTDIATFGTSNLMNVSSENTNIYLDSAIFSSAAAPYTVTLDISAVFLSGAGIVNNSGVMQSFLLPEDNGRYGALWFSSSATAGDMTSYNTVGGYISFHDTSAAGSATFDLASYSDQAHMYFWDSSTAADATINASTGADVAFLNNTTSGNATLNLTTESVVSFEDDANADHAIVNCIGGDQYFGAAILFQQFASAGEGIFTTIGGSTSGEKGAFIDFNSSATADHATFVIGGGLGAGLAATTLTFFDTTTAANANITASGGVGGADGGAIIFTNQSKGGKASISLSGNAELDISTHNAPGVTIGSLAGVGSVLLGANALTIGTNNQSTTFSGVIQDTGGLTKSGSGTLTLSAANTYTGNTTVSAGALLVGNRNGSATGTGSVNVQAGTLAGKGIISGPVAIGTGSGSGAFLAPAAGTNVQATLTIQGALIFNADATYAYTFRAKRNRARTDKVFASGVMINSGAMIALSGQTQGRLTTGLTLTLISNTSANAITGTFSNLPDGAIVTVNGNHLQASYSGGDGNDLTLKVVP